MAPAPWNRLLPAEIILGGRKSFAGTLSDPAQSWVVSGGRSSSPALEVKSLSSKRIGDLIVQSRYIEGSPDIASPKEFPLLPILDYMAWDWIEFHYQPLPNLEVDVLYWVPDPRVICGRHRIHDKNSQPREISLVLNAKVGTGTKGISLSRETFQGRKILSGSSSNQNAVLFLAGNEPLYSGPANGLCFQAVLGSGEEVEGRWILIYCDSETDARDILEKVIKLDWDGEIGRRKIALSGQFQIRTDDADRDFAMAFSQRQARLIFNQLIQQENSCVSEESALDPLQIWQMFLALGPLESSDLMDLLRKAIRKDQKTETSFPLAAELVWQALQSGINPDMVREFIPMINENLTSWFSKENDRDGDGIPEEPGGNFFHLDDHFQQQGVGWIEPPWYSDCLETPDLAALLHNEISQLLKITEVVPGASLTSSISDQLFNLEGFIFNSWQESENRFRSRDYLNHFSEGEFSLKENLQTGWNILRVNLPFPTRIRLRIRCLTKKTPPSTTRVTLLGTDYQGFYRIEELTTHDFLWHDHSGWGISQSIYHQLDHCVVVGMGGNHEIQIEAPGTDRQALSQTLVLWLDSLPAAIGETFNSKLLTESALFRSNYGLKTFPVPGNTVVQLPLNLLAVQGLIRFGDLKLAGDVITCLINAASNLISQTGRLYSTWESETGSGLSEVNQLEGTLPVRLFLDLLGVRFLIGGNLFLEDKYPLLFPVYLFYKGAEITISERETIIYRPGGIKMVYPRGEKVEIQL